MSDIVAKQVVWSTPAFSTTIGSRPVNTPQGLPRPQAAVPSVGCVSAPWSAWLFFSTRGSNDDFRRLCQSLRGAISEMTPPTLEAMARTQPPPAEPGQRYGRAWASCSSNEALPLRLAEVPATPPVRRPVSAALLPVAHILHTQDALKYFGSALIVQNRKVGTAAQHIDLQ